MVQRFMARFTATDLAFIRARFILRAQIEPEEISPDADDVELEQRLEAVIRELEREVERLNASGSRRSAGAVGTSTSTLKPLKKP
ncbi:MAG: hypothetical protein U0269_27265 [Polyangiales bacterium]